MLNLSDNELDRLSREAASQHDPGDLTGPQAWERLEVRLDKELGRAGPDASRGLGGFRRLPFQFAPVILLIVGVSWYLVRQAKGRKTEHSGSPPLTVVKTPPQQPGTLASDSSLKNPVYSDKSTSTPYHQDQNQNTDLSAADGATASAPNSAGTPAATGATSGTSHTSPNPAGSSGASTGSPALSNSSSASTGSPALSNSSGTSLHTAGASRKPTSLSGTSRKPTDLSHTSKPRSNASIAGAGAHNINTRNRRNHRNPANQSTAGANNGRLPDNIDKGSGSLTDQQASGQNATPAGPEWSFVQRPHSLRNHPYISDSALRAFTVQNPADPGKKSGPSLRINRSLTFGLLVAPDFSSVNALAGDKPGSSIGLTLDYQFRNRWHLGTGLLFSKKNYTARGTDYHAPPGYYWQNGIMRNVDFVKGTMTMMEIPINLRYDFSVTGNTLFFVSGGVSTYLFGNEDCNYYYDFAGREVCRKFQYTNKHSAFSSANLSLGVETGISNDFSILVAPYMKLPTSDIGFGKIRMNSVGINVSLRYSPVISRKRQH